MLRLTACHFETGVLKKSGKIRQYQAHAWYEIRHLANLSMFHESVKHAHE